MKEMYVALSGAIAREQQMTLVANNLANVNTAGFKKELAVFRVRPTETNLKSMEQTASSQLNLPSATAQIEGDKNYTALAQTWTDYSTGSMQNTGNSLDLALETRGQGTGTPFFVVETPEGDQLTRAGNFQVNSRQEVVTPAGYAVKGQDGNALKLSAVPQDPLAVSDQGEIISAGQKIGAVQVVLVDDVQQLSKAANGCYQQQADGTPALRTATAADGVVVRNGVLESSNVNIVDELVQMIDLQRNYNLFQKAMQTLDEESSKLISMASTSR
jgi:flagellar basal-body rod protein FlgF